MIGNPPYVEAKKLKWIAVKLKHYDVYSGTADLSVYFIEKGICLCKERGILSYINTNKFFFTEYGKNVREYLLKYQIKGIINCEQVAVFENTLVSTTIFSISIQPIFFDEFVYQKYYQLKHDEFIQKFLIDRNNGFSKFKQSVLDSTGWSFSDDIENKLKKKIEYQNKLICEINGIAVYRGVTTGYNPAFIVNETIAKSLIHGDSKNKEIIKKLLQGRNIRMWTYNESNEYLLFTKQGIKINNYPKIKEHLNIFYKYLKPRRKGEKSEGRKPGCYKWYEIQDNTAYYSEFEKSEKIIWGLTADKWAFAYDNQKHYLPSNGYILTSQIIPIKYLLAILNSKLMKYYFKFIGIMTAGGAYTLKHGTIQELPIKIIQKKDEIIKLVDKILNIKKESIHSDVSNIEQQLDTLVYKIYNLTYDEVKVIEPDFHLNKMEYDNLA